MTSEPWVSTTFPSKVATFFASSAIRLSDSISTGLSRSGCSAFGQLDDARIDHFARAVIRKVHHLRRRKRVAKLAGSVQPLEGEILDDRVGIVACGLCVAAEIPQHRVLQPERERSEKQHQHERQQGGDARSHASSRAMARSSVSWARMISSQTSPAAPRPPEARVTWCKRST